MTDSPTRNIEWLRCLLRQGADYSTADVRTPVLRKSRTPQPPRTPSPTKAARTPSPTKAVIQEKPPAEQDAAAAEKPKKKEYHWLVWKTNTPTPVPDAKPPTPAPPTSPTHGRPPSAVARSYCPVKPASGRKNFTPIPPRSPSVCIDLPRSATPAGARTPEPTMPAAHIQRQVATPLSLKADYRDNMTSPQFLKESQIDKVRNLISAPLISA